MMDLTVSPQSFRCLLRILQIPSIFLLTVTCLPAVTETTKRPIPLRGEIGGGVTFPCLDTNQRSFSSIYLQKGRIYVNGYHVGKHIPTKPWENTRLNQEKNVHMDQLNVSHAGTYTCYIQYSVEDWDEKEIQLILTANYTKPSVKMSCSDTDDTCKVTCTAHGGYPKSKISWDVHALGNASGQMGRAVENPPECDTETELCNISSTASFNCSSGLHRNISCSVDDTEIFTIFSICGSPSRDLPTAIPGSSVVPLAVGAVVTVSVISVLLLTLWKFRKGQRGRRYQTTKQESNVEEGHSLTE